MLANQRGEYYSVTGDVHYDSLSPDDVEKHYRGDVQYCPEDDVHFPTLTVEETLTFAAKTRTPQSRLPDETREQHVNRVVDVLTTVFGLRHVRKTPVGDAAIRGVSHWFTTVFDSLDQICVKRFNGYVMDKPLRLQQSDVFVVILPPLMIRSSREEVSLFHLFSSLWYNS